MGGGLRRLDNTGGWGGRDRTSEWRNQNPLPYRLATPQWAGRAARRELTANACWPRRSIGPMALVQQVGCEDFHQSGPNFRPFIYETGAGDGPHGSRRRFAPPLPASPRLRRGAAMSVPRPAALVHPHAFLAPSVLTLADPAIESGPVSWEYGSVSFPSSVGAPP